MWQRIKQWIDRYWKRHVVDDCPWPDECFDCDKGDCVGCDVLMKATLKPQGDK